MDFKNVSKEICKEYVAHKENIKELSVKSSIVPLAEFYDGYKEEKNNINSEEMPRQHSTIMDFEKMFLAIEEYPKNLLKMKRTMPNESLRLNSTLSVGECQSNLENLKPESISKINEFQQNSAEIYYNFKKFDHKLQSLIDMQNEKQSEEYIKKLQQLNIFARQLETMCNIKTKKSLNIEAETDLLQVFSNIQELLSMTLNDNSQNEPTITHEPQLCDLLELLKYSLIKISSHQSS